MSSDKPEPKRKKRSLVFKLFVLFAGLFALLVLLLALLPYVISLESVKGMVIEEAQKALNRKVEIGAVRISLLTGPGAALEGLIVHNPEGWERKHFIKVGRASAKVELFPLLAGNIRVSRVLLKDGEIVVERDSDGRLSIDDLTGAQASAEEPEPEATPESGSGDVAVEGTDLSALAKLLISRVVVDNVDLAFIDRAIVPGTAVESKVNDLAVELRDIALGNPIDLKLSAKLLTEANDNLVVTGTIGAIPADLDFNKVDVDVSVTFGKLPFSGVNAYLGPDVKFESGCLDLEARAKGSISAGHEVSIGGSLADLDLRDGQGAQLVALGKIGFRVNAKADLTKSRAQLSETKVSLLGIEATAEGSVKGWDSEPELDLTLRTNEFSLGEALKELPLLETVLPSPVRSMGTIRVDATAKGKASDLTSKLRIETKGLSVEAGSFAGGKKGDGGLLLQVDSVIEADAAIVGEEEPEVTFGVKVARLVLDQSAPAASAATPEPAGPSPTPEPAETEEEIEEKKAPAEPQPIEIPVKLSGKLEIKEARVMQFEFADLAVDLALADQALRTRHRLTLYRGAIDGGAKVDLSKASPSVSFQNKITGLDVAGLLKAVDPGLALLGQGTFASSLRVDGALDGPVSVIVQATVENATLIDSAGGEPFPLPGVVVTQNVTADLGRETVEVSELKVCTAGVETTVTGTVSEFLSDPKLDVSLTTNAFDPGLVAKQAPVAEAILGKPLDIKGRVELQAKVSGLLSDLQSRVTLAVPTLYLKSGSFNGGAPKAGGMLLETDGTKADLDVRLKGSELPSVQFAFDVDRVLFDQKPAAAGPAPEPGTPAPKPTPTTPPADRGKAEEAEEPQPIEIPVRLSGKLAVKKARVMQFEFADLAVDVSTADQVLRTTHHLALYRGAIDGGAKVDLSKASPSVSFQNKITGLDVAGLLKAVDPSLNLLGQGTMASSLKVDGALDGPVSVVGEVAMAKATLIDSSGGEPLSLPDVVVTQNVTADLGRETVDLSEVKISAAGVETKVTGTVGKFLSNPEIDVALSTNKFNPGTLAKQIPMLEAILGKPLGLKGSVELQAKVSGVLSDIQSHVALAIPALYLKSGSLNGGEASLGGMLLETDGAKADLDVRLKGSEPPNVRFAFDAKRVLFDQKSAAAAPAPKPEAEPKPETKPPPPSEGLELPPLAAKGTARIAGGRITYLTFQDLVAEISLVDGKASADVSLGLYGGRSKTEVRADLAGKVPEFDAELKLAKVNLGGMLGEFAPSEKLLAGLVGTEINLSGKGITWDVLKKTLTAEGNLAVTKLRGLEDLQKVASSLQRVGSVAGFNVPADLGTRTFRDLKGAFSLRDGRVRTDDLKLSGKDLQGLVKGSVGLDMSVDMEGRLVLLEKLARQFGKKASFLQDEQGAISLPLKIGGTVPSPKLSVDSSGLMTMAKKAMKGKLADELIKKGLADDKKGPLGDILKGALGSGEDDSTKKDDGGKKRDSKKDGGKKKGGKRKDDKKKPEDQVKDILKGLFE